MEFKKRIPSTPSSGPAQVLGNGPSLLLHPALPMGAAVEDLLGFLTLEQGDTCTTLQGEATP